MTSTYVKYLTIVSNDTRVGGGDRSSSTTSTRKPNTASRPRPAKAQAFDSSFVTASTANSSSASLSSTCSRNFVAEDFFPDTTNAMSRTTFVADLADSSSSLTLTDIAEDGRSCRPTRRRNNKDNETGPSLTLTDEVNDINKGTPNNDEHRQSKRQTSFLLKARRKELHHFIFAAVIEAELEGDSDDDDSDDDE
eukprot:CAMPEP_0181026556 /NCGR_PEP_ID=MMETSP1070-20121207/3703_1 /TAXON_ID=265543 /ORGANISM="Minutocellus polymorphus, Strain NH13" /LENGTH=193 /DNA_ID=CAMNT_0023103757 /DNA_START=56 /DNA_END=637 /DNA_ORIENTATION=+